MLRQEELAFIKAVQRSDSPILSSADEESSCGWQEEVPCVLQGYNDERFGPRASERSRELGFDLALVSVSRREQQEIDEIPAQTARVSPLAVALRPGICSVTGPRRRDPRAN
jgi:hypothetical protein